jgi:hypothetical protein
MRFYQHSLRFVSVVSLLVMNAWARVGNRDSAEQADGLLKQMLRDPSNPTKAIRPNTVCFNAAINAWATSKDSDAGSKAFELLQQMKDLVTKEGYNTYQDIVTYNAVL